MKTELYLIVCFSLMTVAGCSNPGNDITARLQDTGIDILNNLNDETDAPDQDGSEPLQLYPAALTCAFDTVCSPKEDSRWVDDLSLDPDVKLAGVKIVAYRIHWFSGSWSPWYVPGVNDLYQKTNLGEPERRAWACFNDHTHNYICFDNADL